MHHAELTDHVRQRARQHFDALQCPPGAARETILIRDGFYCGRRFELDGCRIVWFLEERQLKVSDREGAVIAVEEIELKTRAVHRRAAS